MVRVHKKYGLNPTMSNCFFCGEAKDIWLIGARTGRFKEAGLASSDGEMNREIGVVDTEPCQKCQEYMKQGVILISVRDGEGGKNPYRTGGWCVVKECVIKEAFSPPELIENILEARMSFVCDTAWGRLGLPTEHLDERVKSEAKIEAKRSCAASTDDREEGKEL